ncbi:MAG: OmpA family protein [Steroidobacteraceae bacterium]|jgi:outer membrane protein OmpA-like peptidoglycan-associated protein|nr:OmpA family protein [Steroidobacteraceae bacterium]
MNSLALPLVSTAVRTGAAIAAALLCVATATPARAAEPRASRPESVGVASGFAVGAAAGGPIGALVGAAAGGWLGDRMHRESRAHATARERLALAEQRGDGLVLNLMFRTGEGGLRPEDLTLLERFATIAAATPGARVHVTGSADPRGAAEYNAALAARRATGVASRLIAAGLPPASLVVGSEVAAAPDAAAAAPPDLDGFAFLRRVTLRIEVPRGQAEATLAQRR